jgi:hypothetical protein
MKPIARSLAPTWFQQNGLMPFGELSGAGPVQSDATYFGMAIDQSVKGTARPPRTTVGMTWSKPLCDFEE